MTNEQLAHIESRAKTIQGEFFAPLRDDIAALIAEVRRLQAEKDLADMIGPPSVSEWLTGQSDNTAKSP